MSTEKELQVLRVIIGNLGVTIRERGYASQADKDRETLKGLLERLEIAAEEKKPYLTKAEKEIYVIFRYAKDGTVRYNALPLSTLGRGLYDWSGGREILGNLQRSSMGCTDIYTTEIDWEGAYEINEQGRIPPRPKTL